MSFGTMHPPKVFVVSAIVLAAAVVAACGTTPHAASPSTNVKVPRSASATTSPDVATTTTATAGVGACQLLNLHTLTISTGSTWTAVDSTQTTCSVADNTGNRVAVEMKLNHGDEDLATVAEGRCDGGTLTFNSAEFVCRVKGVPTAGEDYGTQSDLVTVSSISFVGPLGTSVNDQLVAVLDSWGEPS